MLANLHPATAAKLQPLFVTVPEYAAALNVSESLVWKRIYAGQIPVRRIGRCVRIPVAALQQLADMSHPAQAIEAADLLRTSDGRASA